MSRKERHFQGITREIRNLFEHNYFRVIFVSNKFLAATSVGGQVGAENFKKTQCYGQIKIGHETPRFPMFQCFFVFLIFAFVCPSFFSLPLLLDIFKPKNGPLQ